MPGLSIIIPAGDDVSHFEDTLAAVLRNRPRACEVIVPHAGTYADPYELASEVWFIELPTASTQQQCLAQAVERAAGEVIHILSPGCEFDEGWWQAALAQFDDASIGSVSPLVEFTGAKAGGVIGVNYGFTGRKELAVAAGRSERAIAKTKILGPTHRAGFYRRAALKQIGGWPSHLPHAFAAVDVGLSLKRIGYRSAAEPESHISCPPNAQSASAYETSRQNEQVFWRHSPALGGMLAIAARPMFAAAECLAAGGPGAMIGAAAGKIASLGDIGACRAHAAKLQGVKRLTVTTPPKSSGQSHKGEDRTRRAA